MIETIEFTLFLASIFLFGVYVGVFIMRMK
jgi:hypothetical protein